MRAADRESGAAWSRVFRVVNAFPYASLSLPETAFRAGVTEPSSATLAALYDGVGGTQNVFTSFVSSNGGETGSVVIEFPAPVIADTIVIGRSRNVLNLRASGGGFSGTITTYRLPDGAVSSRRFRVWTSS